MVQQLVNSIVRIKYALDKATYVPILESEIDGIYVNDDRPKYRCQWPIMSKVDLLVSTQGLHFPTESQMVIRLQEIIFYSINQRGNQHFNAYVCLGGKLLEHICTTPHKLLTDIQVNEQVSWSWRLLTYCYPSQSILFVQLLQPLPSTFPTPDPSFPTFMKPLTYTTLNFYGLFLFTIDSILFLHFFRVLDLLV